LLVSHNLRFELPVWRILYDAIPTAETHPLVVIELRDKTKVEWCAVDTDAGQIRWRHSFRETDWWTSLIGFYAGQIVLHTYEGSQQPAPKQLLVVDAFSGEINWKLDGCKFEQTDGIALQTSRVQPEKMVTLEYWLLSNGQNILPLSLFNVQESARWKFPILYEEASPYYSVIRSFIQKITNKTSQKAVNYGEIAGHILFFQYLYPANAITLSRSILVVNSAKTVLLDETIDSNVNGAVFGECFYNEHHIIYLKQLEELVVLKLPRL
jgi:hypothetical protein